MKIELVIDENCLSNEKLSEMIETLEQTIPRVKVEVSNFDTVKPECSNLGINILPVWLIDGRPAAVNPYDLNAVLKFVIECKKAKDDDINNNTNIK